MISEKRYDFREIRHSNPGNIPDDICKCCGKSTRKECQNPAIHKNRNSWCGKDIGNRTYERKCPEIKERDRECPDRSSNGERHCFIEKCSEKSEKSREFFPKSDNAYDREK